MRQTPTQKKRVDKKETHFKATFGLVVIPVVHLVLLFLFSASRSDLTTVCKGMKFHRFPLDEHICFLKLTSCKYDLLQKRLDRRDAQPSHNAILFTLAFILFKEVDALIKGPYTWSKRDTNMWPSCKSMPLGSWFCLKNLGHLFDKGTFIWQWGTFIWDGGSFIWQGGTFIWQIGAFILSRVTILLQIIRGTEFWSCVRTVNPEQMKKMLPNQLASAIERCLKVLT